MSPGRGFRSDNNAPVCPEALEAIVRCAQGGHAVGYGDDESTAEATGLLRSLFGASAGVFFVPTGTIANVLCVAALTRSWERVLCHEHSHWNDDESTAPERFTGCRTTVIPTRAGRSAKLTPADVENAARMGRGDVHQPAPGVLTLSNTTEFGEVYTPAEVRALCDAAHALGYRVHMDGARFANAAASLGCAPRELGPDAGVDALVFGGTKNGLALGEAALFFPQGDGAAHRRAVADFPFLRKSAGALLSKHRFVSAPFAAVLRDGAWLRHAGRANTMASRLAEGLARAGLEIRLPTQANAVFVTMPEPVDAFLRARGHAYYMFGDPAWRLARLMCSFDTRESDVDALVADAQSAMAGAPA